MSDEKSDILFIHALTGLHPGSGTALGVVDMPVQRERHTQWPVIPGSSIKGVIRDACRRKTKDQGGGDIDTVFGPENISTNDGAYAGAVSFTDARILAYPVRSLKGVFAWVTCPAVLDRFKRDLGIVKADNTSLNWPTPEKDKAAFQPSLKVENSVVLEEFDFGQTSDPESKLKTFSDWLGPKVTSDKSTQERMKTHLVVLHDDDFTHFVRHATEVVARVGLDYEKKTAKKGALFYQEFLPAETIFYTLTLAVDSRRTDVSMKAENVLKFVAENKPDILQIGADETIGKGLCAVRFMNGGK